jgi:hypothetical protein
MRITIVYILVLVRMLVLWGERLVYVCDMISKQKSRLGGERGGTAGWTSSTSSAWMVAWPGHRQAVLIRCLPGAACRWFGWAELV